MKFLNDFKSFLANSPTAYQACLEVQKKLLAQGFSELKEKDLWKLKKGGSYFCLRGGSLIAFILPSSTLQEAVILASHTDSPALKLKPNAEFIKEGMVMWGVEVYGAPLLSSWLNRDLGVAGKILYTDKKGTLHDGLVNFKAAPCTIPQVAIHLDREVNEKGLLLNKQEHLTALASLQEKPNYLLSLLKEELPIKELLAHDLFLYPLEEPSFIGSHHEMCAGYRMDSLASVYAITTAFLEHSDKSDQTLRMIALFDHEEIGSRTASGAESPFFSHILERIALHFKLDRDAYLRLIPHSTCLSVDLGHSVHPNYAEKHDPHHKPKLGSGILIKTHAQKKYATDLTSIKKVLAAIKKEKIPYQMIASRNDIPSGSTIGPIHAALTGIPTVDIGIGQLSMHSARELIATQDLVALKMLLSSMVS